MPAGPCVRSWILVAVLTTLVSGCTIVEGADDSAFFVSDISVRLFPGFELGDDRLEVERVVGPPDAISEGDFNGFVYEYGRATGSGNSPQVEVHFSHDYESRAVAITVRAPYPTVTAEGIGIGATVGAVQRVLGKRESSERETDWGSFGGLFRGDIYDGLSRQSMCVSYDSTGHVNRIDLFITAID